MCKRGLVTRKDLKSVFIVVIFRFSNPEKREWISKEQRKPLVFPLLVGRKNGKELESSFIHLSFPIKLQNYHNPKNKECA